MQICGITNKMGRGNMPLNDGNTCNSGSGRLWNTNSVDDPPWHRTFIESIVYLVYWILHARTFVFLRSLTIPNCPTIMQHIKNSGEYLSESSIPMADLSQFSIEHSDTCCLCQHMIDNLSPSAPYTGTYWMMSWFQDTHSWICTHCGEPCSSFQEMGAHTSMQAFPFFHFLTVEIIAAIPCPPMIRFCAWNARELFKDTTP